MGSKAREGHTPCLTCKIPTAVYAARLNGHEGYCCKECQRGKIKKKRIRYLERYLSKEEKKKNRQVRRNNKKKIPGNFFLSQEWRELRFKVLRKFGPVCMLCFRKAKPGFPMHVDHIRPRSKYPELELEFENLQVLCEDCNMGKLNHTEDDFRPTSVIALQ